MVYKKYIYKGKNIKLILEEDIKDIGWYLIIYDNPNSNISIADYVYDTEEIAFKNAEKKFGVKKNQWTLLKDE